MRRLSKLIIVAIVLTGIVGLGLVAWWLQKPKALPAPSGESVIIQQSSALTKMASRTAVLGITREDLSWEGQKPTSLSQIYKDLWPLVPPVFPKIPPLAWQMGWADGRIVFFLDGLPADVCQSLNHALNVKNTIPDSLWSKQNLLRRKASLPPVKDPALAHRGCVKTIFATHLYYEIL
jgi:hypothetical protein